MGHLPSIPSDIIIPKIISIQTILLSIIRLPLPARGREETFFAFPATAHTWWITWIINASEIAFYFAPPAGYAGLVDAFMLYGRGLDRRGCGGGLGG
jgi:hypothetical protein